MEGENVTTKQTAKVGRPRLSEDSETKFVGLVMPAELLEEVLASGDGSKSDRIRRVLRIGLDAINEDI